MKGSKSISLFIDTSTYRFEISLVIDTKVRVISHENTKTVTEKTNLLINRLLMSENLKLEDVDCLYTLLGPGSNTGIRVGLTICKIVHTLNPKVNYDIAHINTYFLIGLEISLSTMLKKTLLKRLTKIKLLKFYLNMKKFIMKI